MARFYGLRVKSRKMTIDEVPLKWREDTEVWINENGGLGE